jgi:radical SAM superfamily enzyme YgiQ (UPF0313 family)
MGPYVLASALEQSGYTVTVIDWFTYLPNIFEYLENFISKETIFVGVSTTFLIQQPAKTFARTDVLKNYDSVSSSCSLWLQDPIAMQNWFAKLRVLLNKYNTNAKIAIGGRKADALYKYKENELIKQTFQNVDYAFIRESELSILDILNNAKGSTKTIERNNIQFVLNTYPKHCPGTEFKEHWGVQPGEGLPIEISRGCSFNCKFCYYDKRASYRKDINLLKTEFLRNYDRFGTTTYFFRDDCFNDNYEKTLEVCNMICSLPFKIRWVSYARVDLGIKYPDSLSAMMDSGASGLCWGIESLNYKALKLAGKGMHPDKVKEFLLSTYSKYRKQCLYHSTFIVGLPGETEETQWETTDWFINNKCLDSATWGALDFPDQDPNFDSVLRQYPDYVKDPQRYGFIDFRNNPMYWKHSTMDSNEANELSRKVADKWRGTGNSMLALMWFIPRLITLGYTWEDIRYMADNPTHIHKNYAILQTKDKDWLEKYWSALTRR